MTPTPDRRCGTCLYYVYARGPTGRKHTTERGACMYVVPWPAKWPACYINYNYAPGPILPPPSRDVWPNSGEDCPCWEPLTKETLCPLSA